MTTMFEEAGVFGREFADSGIKSLAAFSKSAQAIAVETTDYAKASYEAGAAALEKLMAARTLETAIEVQTDYARSAYESFVAEASKLGALYADLAKDSYKPFESMTVRAR